MHCPAGAQGAYQRAVRGRIRSGGVEGLSARTWWIATKHMVSRLLLIVMLWQNQIAARSWWVEVLDGRRQVRRQLAALEPINSALAAAAVALIMHFLCGFCVCVPAVLRGFRGLNLRPKWYALIPISDVRAGRECSLWTRRCPQISLDILCPTSAVVHVVLVA